jgi:hypothetical protein
MASNVYQQQLPARRFEYEVKRRQKGRAFLLLYAVLSLEIDAYRVTELLPKRLVCAISR